jgi:acetyl esterase/lipase
MIQSLLRRFAVFLPARQSTRIALLAVGLLIVPAVARAQDEKPIEVIRDLTFGTGGGKDLKLDLAQPTGDGPFPAVFCLHAGGWVAGDRHQMEQTIRTLAARGYVALTPDYRLAPENPFPAAIEDCKAAVRWLRANAGRFKVDPNRIGAVGFASGGHLACLLGVTEKSDGLEGTGGNADVSSRVQAVVSFFGPTDLARTDWDADAKEKNLVPLLGGKLEDRPAEYRKASPQTYARKGAPPFLFIHGSEDKIVSPSHSKDMAEKLTLAGGSARVVMLDGEGHGIRGESLRTALSQMMTFFDDNLKRQSP